MRLVYWTLIFLLFSIGHAQNSQYPTFLLSDTLTLNANAVVRFEHIDIAVPSQRTMVVTTKRIVSVLNDKGLGAIAAVEHYDRKTTVKSIEATVYDASGREIKKLKRKDFRDQTAVDNATMFSDSRVLVLNYTPVQYPFTIIYESTIETSNTAFIPEWYPLSDFYVSIEKSMLTVKVAENLGFKKKLINIGNFPMRIINESVNGISILVEKIPAQKYEPYAPRMSTIFPHVMMALELFHLEGVDGTAKNWTDFGKWFNDKILTGTTELPEETISKIRSIVGNEKDPIVKAKIVYDFVQQKSRYVSIQEGIGGWKPMLASDVDRLGYGDCKALSNYTRSLLAAVGVTAYYTRLYGGTNKRDVIPDFVSMQSNHVILAIPNDAGYVFLECTSQTDPFGYQGTFTDDRNVLIMKPDGAEIARTTDYDTKMSRQTSSGRILLNPNGDIEGTVEINSDGTQYASKFDLERMQPFERDTHYKDYWSAIGNLKIEGISFANDRDNVKFTERARIKATEYGKISGNRMLVPVNAYNRATATPNKTRDRKLPFELSRGFFDADEIEIKIPDGFSIEVLPEKIVLDTKFGEYAAEVLKKDESTAIYKRKLNIKKGFYDKTEYEDYRQFMERVAKNDNSKLVLIRTK